MEAKLANTLAASNAFLAHPANDLTVEVDDDDDDLSWCDRVCVYENVWLASTVWCDLPQPIMELVFARLPLRKMLQLRVLSKMWRSLITSASFQDAFGSTPTCRVALVDAMLMPGIRTEHKRLWFFETVERMSHCLPFDFIPVQYNVPVAGDGGLLCCGRQLSLRGRGNQGAAPEQDLQLYVCNPLTRAYRKLPLPSHVSNITLLNLVLNRQTNHYTITVVDDSHPSETKPRIELYSSATNTWNSGPGVFNSPPTTNLIYYKVYSRGEYHGMRAYDKTTGRVTSKPIRKFSPPLFEGNRYWPLAEYQGEVYKLETVGDCGGIWVLKKDVWVKVCEVPHPERIPRKVYQFSLGVNGEVILIYGTRWDYVDATYIPSPHLYSVHVLWMFERAKGRWVDVGVSMEEFPADLTDFPQILLEMRLDHVP